jgi:hypothetical protein
LAHSIISDTISTLSRFCEGAPQAVIPDADFVLGQDVLYTDGEGNQERVVYKGATPDGQWHTLQQSNTSKLITPGSNLCFLKQTNFSNIPSTLLHYHREVDVGLSKEEAQHLAYPRNISLAQQELLSWHHCLYHLSFGRQKWKILPHSILACNYKPPFCVTCQFGQAHCRPWCRKGKASGSICKLNKVRPGDGTSVVQIVSAQPGLIPQMAGFPTSNRIWGMASFCNHVSNFIYFDVLRNFTLAETMLAKRVFKKVLAQTGCTSKHYHANNGWFSDKGFHQDITNKGQSSTFCGVGAHHQNGIIENRNKQLTLGACTLLLHGMRHWPQMVDSMFLAICSQSHGQTHELITCG